MKTKLFRSFAILIIVMGGFFIFGKNSLAATADHLVISEIQITGGTGQTGNDFIELYNPADTSIDLDGYRLVKRTASGITDTSIKSWTSPTIIPAHGYYLWASSSYTLISVTPDTTTSQTISDNNGVALRYGAENTGIIIDSIAWGTATNIFVEGVVFSNNPDANQSIERKFGGDLGNGEDTDNNSTDFNLQTTSNPQNVSSPPKPDLPPPPTPFCGDGTCDPGEDCDTCPEDCPISPPPTEINPGDITINEFVAYQIDESVEWIELYNKTLNDVSLTNWTIEDGTEHPKSLTGLSISANDFLVLEKGADFTFSLNDSGDVIKLKIVNPDATISIIDQVAYGNWDDGNISDNAPKASDPNSTARKTDGGDTNIDKDDFAVTTDLTPGEQNTITSPPDEETGGGGSTPTDTTPSSPPSWPVGALLINEFVADPTDGEVEWIEFYNPGSTVINLNNWTVEDGSETATALSGSIGPLGFFVLEKPKGILNNTGDAIILKDPAGLIIDQISYGDFDDGEKSDNAPTASDPNSTARKTDGQNTTDDFNDFVVTTPTRGTSNSGGLQQNPNGAYSRDIIINEVLPNPKGDDTQGEFIELKNIGATDIDLTGWKIGDASSKRYTIKTGDLASIILKPKELFVLYRKVTGIALNNSGTEAAKIYSPDGALVHQIEYSGAAAEDESFSRETENYFWTSTPTPDKENIITRKNQTPSAAISAPDVGEINQTISFDGSDSTDPDGDELIFSWNLGDGSEAAGANVNHAYLAAGKYKIILTVKDALGAADTAEQYILITDPMNADEIIPPAEQLIFINELIPNPEGSDDAEWIEIKSIDVEPLDLSGWKLDDDEGGSRPYKIPDGTIIAPGQFLIFKKEQTKLALNNTYDSARLLDPDGEIFFETSYDEVPENASWAREENGNWKWTTKLTPGAENIFQFQEKTSAKKSGSSSNKKSTTFTPITLEEIRNLELNDGVRVSGQVIVEPGVLGSQIFYIASVEACPGIQIYMYSKNFPELKLGDLVEVTGVLAESGGEKRIKISAKENIKVLENKEAPAPTPIKLSEVEEGLEGCLVSAAGELTEKSGSNLYFADDDGELKIYFKSTLSFPKPKMAIGDEIETVGIVSQTKTGFRLLPRYETDLKIQTPTESEELSATDTSAENGGNKINLYLGAATGLLGLTLVGLGIKSGTFGNWWKKIKGI